MRRSACSAQHCSAASPVQPWLMRPRSGGCSFLGRSKVGYPRAFCGATIAAASTIDILIPPSIPLILYSLVSNASIGALVLCRHRARACCWPSASSPCAISVPGCVDSLMRKEPVAWGEMGKRGLYAMPALADAGAGAARAALRRAYANRDQHHRRRLRDAGVGAVLSRPDMDAYQELHLHGRDRDRRCAAADHGVDRGWLDPHAGADSRAVPRLGQGQLQHASSRSSC